jgi:cation diffusion facilitator family transporter
MRAKLTSPAEERMFGHAHHHEHSHGHNGADGEKRSVALWSVLAALLLTGTKVVVGLWTGSLGILAEALHSGLDLAATVVTLWAVQAAGRPADSEHNYGHGKIENISALFQTLLLFVTCTWIIWEAIARLFLRAEVHVDANVWAFIVVAMSIVVDLSRSRALMRVARKYHSQALEADALHFTTDIWSSLVVLVGLLGVVAAHRFGIPWLAKTDAVAALGVAGVVVWASFQLGRKSIRDLLDTVPQHYREEIGALALVEGVREVRQVRVRRSGPEVFVDLALVVDAAESLERSHDTADRAEAAIRSRFPKADIVVHVEPAGAPSPGQEMLATARRMAARQEASAHNLYVYDDDGRLTLDLHLEMAEDLALDKAHQRASRFEEDMLASVPGLEKVVTHIEPAGELGTATGGAEPNEVARVRECLMRFPELTRRGVTPRELQARRAHGELAVSFHCTLPGAMSVKEAHAFTERIEHHLRTEIPELGRVTVHTEPDRE